MRAAPTSIRRKAARPPVKRTRTDSRFVKPPSPNERTRLESGSMLFAEGGTELGSAAARALAILEVVGCSGEPVSAVELSPRLGLPKPTVHRQMLLLEEL